MATVVEKTIDVQQYEKDFLLQLYESMVKMRTFDEKIIKLLQDGKVSGFYHAGIGQEATSAGSCANLKDSDYIMYNHRGCNQMIGKGVSLVQLFGDFLGNVGGTTKGLGAGIVHSADPKVGVLGQSGTLGACFTISVGVAHAIRFAGTDQVCVCYFGDGTSAREVFHGGLNWASLYKLPVIFFLENNQWGKSTHYKNAHGIKRYIADHADSYDIPSYFIDGNDVLLVYEVMKEAVERGRKEGTPTFIEALTFRHRGHFEGDPGAYVDPNLKKEWMETKDPITNYKAKLLEASIVSPACLEEIDQSVDSMMDAAIEEAEKYPQPSEERIYQGLFKEEV